MAHLEDANEGINSTAFAEEAAEAQTLEERIAAIRERAHRQIALDGNLTDAIKGMNGIMSERNSSICAWGCRVVSNYARVNGRSR